MDPNRLLLSSLLNLGEQGLLQVGTLPIGRYRRQRGRRLVRLVQRLQLGAAGQQILHQKGQARRGKAAPAIVNTTLAALRTRAGINQIEMAEKLGVRQGNISKIENRGDMRLSTLQNYLAAIGGRLELRAVVGREMFVLDIEETRGSKRPRHPLPAAFPGELAAVKS